MVVKVYISGISGNKEVKKRQQRVLMILDSKNIKYDVIDITEPGRETDKDFMQNNSKSNGGTVSDPNPRSPLPPQIFNDDEYCGDYDQFDLANEVDTLEQFLKVELPPEDTPKEESEQVVNGDVTTNGDDKEKTQEKDVPEENKTEVATEETAIDKKTPSRETTPADKENTKESSPEKDKNEDNKEDSVKEASPERQKSVEKDDSSKDVSNVPETNDSSPTTEGEGETKEKSPSPLKDNDVESKSKESSPEKEESVNENGTASSRETSEEKENVDKKIETPSEALIASEQASAAE
ncbi:hypothetical protein ACJJTC_019589 [Scirpophaga incertulas]